MMISSAGAGRREMLHCLLVAGADPDIRVSSNNNTALHAAAEADHLEVARLLLDYKADLNITNLYGLTPLDIAVTFNRTSLIELFNNYKPATH